MSVGKELKRLRGNQSQQQLSFDYNVSRESISAYETERAMVPKDISRKFVKDFNDPFFAMEIRREYTGTGPVKLDGAYVDLHRSSVKAKLLEEMKEAMEAVDAADLVNLPSSLKSFERESIIEMLVQAVDVQTAIEHFVAVICKEYDIKYTEVWTRHYQKLVAHHYVNKESIQL